jgi:hypothetical protein
MPKGELEAKRRDRKSQVEVVRKSETDRRLKPASSD